MDGIPADRYPPVVTLRDPTVTVRRDGEAAVEVSPKRISKQWAATYGQGPAPTEVPVTTYWPPEVVTLGGGGDLIFRPHVITYGGTLREVTYKKSKKRGTEKLRCKLDGLDADLVDDLVGLPAPVPCTIEFRTPCDE